MKNLPLPPLTDARREAFAQAFVRSGNKSAAYREAGYAGGRGGGAKLAAKAPVAARIVELEKLRGQTCAAGLEDTIAGLLALATAADALNTAPALKEARLAHLEANRLWTELTAYQDEESSALPPELTEAEWVAKYGNPAPGGGV